MSDIKFNGLNEVLESLDKAVSQETINKALTKACLLVERAAKQNAPKGTLRNSIQSKVEDGKGIVFTNLEYAPYVEYGTGLFAEGGKGRKDVPWVYVEGSGSDGKEHKYKKYTKQEAVAAVEFLREQGLDAKMTYGQHPQPYMRPALDANRERIKQILREEILNND